MTDIDHKPVMLDEVVTHLQPANGEVYVDGTFGGGGYSRALLEAADCTVIAIDRDPAAEARARDFENHYAGRFEFIRGRFGAIDTLIGTRQVNGFVLDIGLSSYQIEESGRGFSFKHDGPLDMRMDPDNGGESAADIVNSYAEKDLADLIYTYGEERHSRRIARQIAARRDDKPFASTRDLAETVRAAVPKAKDGIDPATRTFQARRIAVNEELKSLEIALRRVPDCLLPGGRLIVVSFHSLEDRIVKNTLKAYAGRAHTASRHHPAPQQTAALFTLPASKAVKPADAEIAENPRARSARMRVAIRTEAPA